MRVQVGKEWLFFDVEGPKLVADGPAMKERPTLLLLHGGPGFDHSSFKPAFSTLADTAQVVYLDHLGNGRSDRGDPSDWNLERWGDDVRDFCDALEIEKPIVLGQSFGGMVAMSYAARHPDHPGKLILSSTTAKTRLDRVFDAFERLGGLEARGAAERYWAKPGSDTLPDYAKICMPLYSQTPQDPDGSRRTVWNFDVMFAFGDGEDQSLDMLADLKSITCPTLVLVGEEDPITPLADSEDIAAALSGARVRFERFPGCGHGVFRDSPESAFAVIREFLTEIP
jgi:proline iminopeptidase